MSDVLADLPVFVSESEPWFRASLRSLVEQPTISPGVTDKGPILAGVEVAAALMRESGAEVEIVPSAGTPALIARFSSGGHPAPKARIVVYNHFDVQPATAANWDQDDPFRFEVREDPQREVVYMGRGTTDDKGPALCALRAAQWVAQHELPIEVVLLWETEEEIGSPNFGEILEARKSLLAGDAVIVSDTIWPSAGHPAISTGLRGGLLVSLSLRTGEAETHSGLTGGVARNPLRELANLASAIGDAEFWRLDALAPSQQEVESYLRTGFDAEYFRKSHRLEQLESDVPLEMMLRLWARPTFEIHGLVGGYTGPGIKSTIPANGELKVSFRLVPNQHPAALLDRLTAFVKGFNPAVEVRELGSFEPYQGHITGPIHEAIVHGMTQGFGREPALVREGGSIGAVPQMARVLGVPIHFLPLSLPEHGYHAPNETFDWRQAKGGIASYVHAFAHLVR
ncbi:Acetylornithine deacetylase/Succinyl-diaminopimelate desuccinylase [Enhygromyxa salina]|uniref:Acetylornithine deacetylase/Succinyl-diaminopimelate desuccinylase n=1 Tax=Enhygromyxa salina TaxID=215803 RepID=A0A0C1ZMP4_9BACT|nr:M20/M25/M40 family metallo-hydrolase [Enhygromyxa salina]KIG12313.1 Acetylornithine deacetylase/Succinyl-diaminopimelate desuccinylase [Enhygromyxa salina]